MPPGTLRSHSWEPKKNQQVCSRSVAVEVCLKSPFVGFSFARLLFMMQPKWIFLLQLLMIVLEMLYWVVSTIKRWSWSYGSSISTIMSELTLMMSAVEECLDCCSKNAAASAELILAELFVLVVKLLLMYSVGVVCRFLLCTGCQRAACSLIWRNCMQESWITFVLIAFDFAHF